MYSRPVVKTKRDPLLRAGSILVAQPFWQDEKYQRSVIILLDHDAKESSGIILNKQSNLCVGDTLPDLNIAPPLYFGGPFHPEIISFIHSNKSVPGAFNLRNELFYGGEYEPFKEMILNKKIKRSNIKFFSGFVKWGPGELEAELREKKWWTSEITAQEFFNSPVEDLWAYELLANGHIYGMMNEFPDPGLN